MKVYKIRKLQPTIFCCRKPMPDIVDTAMSAGTFTTLVAAITAAGLDTALKSAGPFTVFAPSDEAFSKLPSGTIEALLEDLSTLRKILEYHVVSGKVTSAEVIKLDKVTTTEGTDVKITSSNDHVKVNNSTVITPDIETDNGIIHVVDTVLLPESISL